jgi:hypothetical protein
LRPSLRYSHRGNTLGRYRLRFLLQELDLPRGTTVIGRSLDCNITIEDPLVSRQHARIVVDDQGGHVEDMGSRNGVRVNGLPIREATPLRDGDRIRIGTQDFVFCCVEPAGKAHSKTTGVLRLCARCRLPYPREMVACPNCEAIEQTDEETLSGSFGKDDTSVWGVQLLVEALERALTLGRIADADRLVRRATAQVEELVASGHTVDAQALGALAAQVAATTLATNDPTWALWVLETYQRLDRVPPMPVVERLGEAATAHSGIMRGALDALVEQLDAAGGGASPDAKQALARLAQIRRSLVEAGGDPGAVTGEWPGSS